MDEKQLKKFGIFVVVYLIAFWVGNFITTQLQSSLGTLGWLGAITIFLLPLVVLYYAMRRFVFTREG